MEPTNVLKESHQPSLLKRDTDEIIHHIMKIGQLSQLHENWDSYEGKGIPFEVCEKAAKYLYAAFKELSTEIEAVDMPFIAPASDGSIVFEWNSKKAELTAVFRSNDQLDVEYLTVENANGSESEKEGKFDSLSAFVQAVKWFSLNKV